MKLALSMICENPFQRTGLTTLFHEMIRSSIEEFPEIDWLLFLGPEQPWEVNHPRIELVRRYPSNERRWARLWADHFLVGPDANRRGAEALLTIGFVPLRAPLPTVMHVFALHHLTPGGGLRAWYRKNAVARGMVRALLVIANSQWTADQLATAHPRSTAKVVVSPEGVQHNLFAPLSAPTEDVKARSKLKLPAEYIFWSSNFYPYKRAELAVAAYAQLDRELRSRFPLVLSGSNWGDGISRARHAASQLGVLNDLMFLGWVEDEAMPACFRGARLHVLSTEEETFGRSVLDAMACGCPCVLQELPVLREITTGAALFCDYKDARLAGSMITQLCMDDQLHRKIREEGLAQAKKFSFSRLVNERLRAVQTALGSR